MAQRQQSSENKNVGARAPTFSSLIAAAPLLVGHIPHQPKDDEHHARGQIGVVVAQVTGDAGHQQDDTQQQERQTAAEELFSHGFCISWDKDTHY